MFYAMFYLYSGFSCCFSFVSFRYFKTKSRRIPMLQTFIRFADDRRRRFNLDRDIGLPQFLSWSVFVAVVFWHLFVLVRCYFYFCCYCCFYLHSYSFIQIRCYRHFFNDNNVAIVMQCAGIAYKKKRQLKWIILHPLQGIENTLNKTK